MPFSLDYFLLIFLATCGVLQLISLLNGLIFISFTTRFIIGLPLAIVLIAGPFIWFFISENRNVSDTAIGLDGNQQAILFILGSLAGLIFTLIVTSLRRTKLDNYAEHYSSGLDALRQTSYLRALTLTFRRINWNEKLRHTNHHRIKQVDWAQSEF